MEKDIEKERKRKEKNEKEREREREERKGEGEREREREKERERGREKERDNFIRIKDKLITLQKINTIFMNKLVRKGYLLLKKAHLETFQYAILL